LRATGRAGKPLQFFCEKLEGRYGERHGLDPVHDYAGYVRGIVQRTSTRNNVVGVKLMGLDLERFLMRLRQTGAFGTPAGSELQILQAALPRLQFIQIRRRDRLRQAISRVRALQSDLWKSGDKESAVAKAKFDPRLISQSIQAARRVEEIWSAFFFRNGIEPFLVEYEDLAADYAGSVRAVLKFLRIRLARGFEIGEPTTVRQADAISQKWEERYRALVAERSDLVTYV